MRRTLIALLLFFAVLPAAAATLSDKDRADVARVEAYLNATKTMNGRFLQIAPDGSSSEGQFWLSRPGRLRFEYDPPVPVLVVADGTFLIFNDKELGQVDRIPLGSSPIGILVREKVELSGGLTVEGVERQPGLLRVSVYDTLRPREGRIILTFTDTGSALALRQWRVIDAQGQTTNVMISSVAVNEPLSRQLFVFIDPTPEERARDKALRGR
jgi:outer membrane lipoprotein-sorting protein